MVKLAGVCHTRVFVIWDGIPVSISFGRASNDSSYSSLMCCPAWKSAFDDEGRADSTFMSLINPHSRPHGLGGV